MKTHPRLIYALFIATSVAASALAQDLKIVAHESVSEDTLTAEKVQDIYLGKKTRWAGGKKIIPLMLGQDNQVHLAFAAAVIKKPEPKFSGYWKLKLFIGEDTPPKAFAAERELVEYLSATEGAVGYVSASTDLMPYKSVKVLHLGH
jgi:ABC-type phosphate transport system substrate-binding protein